MKKNNSLDEYIKKRFEDWAEWYQKSSIDGLGYPRRNIIARLKEEGGVLINGTGQKPDMINHSAEEIEMLLAKLFQQRPQHVEVLRIYYLNPHSYVRIAKEKGYSRARYFVYLGLAHEWVKGYFTVKNIF